MTSFLKLALGLVTLILSRYTVSDQIGDEPASYLSNSIIKLGKYYFNWAFMGLMNETKTSATRNKKE